jgi:WD40 repeat protein
MEAGQKEVEEEKEVRKEEEDKVESKEEEEEEKKKTVVVEGGREEEVKEFSGELAGADEEIKDFEDDLIVGDMYGQLLQCNSQTGGNKFITKLHKGTVIGLHKMKEVENTWISNGADNLIKVYKDKNFKEPAGILRGHTGWVNDICEFGPGKICSCSDDTSVKMWNTQTMELIEDNQHFSKNLCIEKIDQNRVAYGVEHRSVQIWNWKKWKTEQPLYVDHMVNSLLLLQDGRLAVSIWSGEVHLYDLKGKGIPEVSFKAECENHTLSNSLFQLPDGKIGVASKEDHLIKIFNLKKNKYERRCRGHKDTIFDVMTYMHNEVPYVVSASADKSVKCWNMNTGKCKEIWHKKSLYSVAPL